MANIPLHCQQCKSFDKLKGLCELYQEKAYADSIACSKFEKKVIQESDNTPLDTTTIRSVSVQHLDSDISPIFRGCKYGLKFSNKSFSRPFSPKGRIGRGEYLLWMIILGILYFIAKTMIENPNAEGQLFFGIILMLFICIVGWFQIIKRCHDRNMSGWWSLLQIIPIANFILGIILLFFKGDDGENYYGNSPR